MMAWEHLVLGNGLADLRTECDLLVELGRDPEDVDLSQVRGRYPGVEPLRLPGSGMVVTVGELNVLADYFSHPDGIAAAPAEFMLPLVQSVRSQSLVQLRRVMGRRGGDVPVPSARLPGALRYSRQRRMSELREGIALTMAGRRSGLVEWELYPSVIARNAAHFAPFSWYRWQAFHLDAREMIVRSDTLPSAERERLRGKARLYAGYADHFLQDSFAAGHLANKTLVMQWYAEWVTRREGWSAEGWPALAATTCVRQPLLHGPSLYYPEADPAADRMRPFCAQTGTDPQTMVEVSSLEGRIRASGVTGLTPRERQTAYLAYLALLNDASAQFAAGIVHGYFNRRSLTVASQSEGHVYQIWGDRTMFMPGPTVSAGMAHAAAAACASRQAIAELLATGRTEITTREIFGRFPRYVKTERGLVPLPQWHQTALRDLCFRELFGRWDTRAARLATTFWPRLPMSSWTKYAALTVPTPEAGL